MYLNTLLKDLQPKCGTLRFGKIKVGKKIKYIILNHPHSIPFNNDSWVKA